MMTHLGKMCIECCSSRVGTALEETERKPVEPGRAHTLGPVSPGRNPGPTTHRLCDVNLCLSFLLTSLSWKEENSNVPHFARLLCRANVPIPLSA